MNNGKCKLCLPGAPRVGSTRGGLYHDVTIDPLGG
jgi:hypothetical protein